MSPKGLLVASPPFIKCIAGAATLLLLAIVKLSKLPMTRESIDRLEATRFGRETEVPPVVRRLLVVGAVCIEVVATVDRLVIDADASPIPSPRGWSSSTWAPPDSRVTGVVLEVLVCVLSLLLRATGGKADETDDGAGPEEPEVVRAGTGVWTTCTTPVGVLVGIVGEWTAFEELADSVESNEGRDISSEVAPATG